ncbi:hypothetical protein L484_016789 [Morus notabilis]|uniref:Uncharacterized protein n=1 Tax=Morus notabilis TaxID=981085 RepID=W9SCF1_9ROSA|nr:hypothetical protein L484_016789 [Morus notabilis]
MLPKATQISALFIGRKRISSEIEVYCTLEIELRRASMRSTSAWDYREMRERKVERKRKAEKPDYLFKDILDFCFKVSSATWQKI